LWLVWQRQLGSGSTVETMTLPSFTGPKLPVFSAPGGISVQIPEGSEIKTQIQTLSQRKDVNWQSVKLAFDQWSYKQEGLAPATAEVAVQSDYLSKPQLAALHNTGAQCAIWENRSKASFTGSRFATGTAQRRTPRANTLLWVSYVGARFEATAEFPQIPASWYLWRDVAVSTGVQLRSCLGGRGGVTWIFCGTLTGTITDGCSSTGAGTTGTGGSSVSNSGGIGTITTTGTSAPGTTNGHSSSGGCCG